MPAKASNMEGVLFGFSPRNGLQPYTPLITFLVVLRLLLAVHLTSPSKLPTCPIRPIGPIRPMSYLLYVLCPISYVLFKSQN